MGERDIPNFHPALGNFDFDRDFSPENAGSDLFPPESRGAGYFDNFGRTAGERFKGLYCFILGENWHSISPKSQHHPV